MEETQGTKETEGTRWRIGVLSAAQYRDAMISEPVDDAALADTLRKLSAQLPPGFKAFAFASRGDSQFDDGVAAAAVDSLATLAAFSNEPSLLEGSCWYGCDIRRRVRFDEECDAKALAREVRKNERLASDFDWRFRRLRFLFEILAALFLALAVATAWMAFRGSQRCRSSTTTRPSPRWRSRSTTQRRRKMEETKETKETEGTRWRVGIVAPGSSPSMAMDPRAFTDEEAAAVAGEYSEAAPENCCVFAFRSRSESFDERCATLAALSAVQIGKGEFGIGDVFGLYGDQITDLKSRLQDQARTCIDLRGKLQDARRRVIAAVAAGLAIGVLLGGLAGFLLFSEHAPFRVADDHAQEERAGRAEDFPGGGAGQTTEGEATR